MFDRPKSGWVGQPLGPVGEGPGLASLAWGGHHDGISPTRRATHRRQGLGPDGTPQIASTLPCRNFGVKTLALLTALALAATTSSCASIMGRAKVLQSTNPRPLPFLGVVYDAALVANAVEQEVPWWMRTAAALDLPLSACVDLVLLPIDLVWLLAHDGDDRAVEPPPPVESARGTPDNGPIRGPAPRQAQSGWTPASEP